MPRPIRQGRDARRVCVAHRHSCSWAGGELVESGKECRAATNLDRQKGVGIFTVPTSPVGLDDAVLALVASADDQEPAETVAAYRTDLAVLAEQRLAEWRRRDRQPWAEWLAEEQASAQTSAEQMNELVGELVADVERAAQRPGEDDR